MTEQEEKMWAEDLKMISKLNVEVDVLQQRIDKAIEYIENENLRIVDISKEIPELCDGKLLEILKGN